MYFRHEWKHEISAMDLLVLRQRLRAVAAPDAHAVNGSYRIRSLYFDTPNGSGPAGEDQRCKQPGKNSASAIITMIRN